MGSLSFLTLIISVIIYFAFHCRSCYVNKQLISIGDDVIIDIENDKEAVCQIKDFYNDDSQEEPRRAVIHWYFKKHELPSKVHEKIPRFLSDEYELFLPLGDEKNLRGCVDDIDAETIQKKCFLDFKPSLTDGCDDKYFIRFGFTIDYKLVSGSELCIHLSEKKLKRKCNALMKAKLKEISKTNSGRCQQKYLVSPGKEVF